MSRHRLDSRVSRLEAQLEAQHPAEAEASPSSLPFEPPEGWDAWYEEVIRLLWEHGLFNSVEEMVQRTFGLTDPAEVADMAARTTQIVEETPPAF